VTSSAFTSISPKKRIVLRFFSEAAITLPSKKVMSTCSSLFFSTNEPVFCWLPISWKMSAMPKSLMVPESAIR